MSSTTPNIVQLKQKFNNSVENIPLEGLKELESFLDFLNYRFPKEKTSTTKYKPVALEGLWEGMKINDQDIQEIRKEMWGSLEDKNI